MTLIFWIEPLSPPPLCHLFLAVTYYECVEDVARHHPRVRVNECLYWLGVGVGGFR